MGGMGRMGPMGNIEHRSASVRLRRDKTSKDGARTSTHRFHLGLSSPPLFAILAGMFRTQDLRVKEIVRLIEPAALKGALPITEVSGKTVFESREAVKNIL